MKDMFLNLEVEVMVEPKMVNDGPEGRRDVTIAIANRSAREAGFHPGFFASISPHFLRRNQYMPTCFLGTS